MGKIITAKDLLKEKGFVLNKFDTAGFMNAVAEFFSEREVNSRLFLCSLRFLDIETKEGIEKMKEEGDYGWDYHEYFDLSDDERKRGWKAMTEERYQRSFDHYLNSYGEEGFTNGAINFINNAWLPHSFIIVDKPFYENSLSMLRIMGGYVVEKRRRGGHNTAVVSLI